MNYRICPLHTGNALTMSILALATASTQETFLNKSASEFKNCILSSAIHV